MHILEEQLKRLMAKKAMIERGVKPVDSKLQNLEMIEQAIKLKTEKL